MSRPEFRCSVRVQYLPDQSSPPQGPFAFSYTVTIVNTGDIAAQLVARQWLITDAGGHTEEVRGLAVVGHQPLLQPGEKFEYTSGCQLDSPVGSMRGSYQMTAEDGTQFEVEIPEFTLMAPRVLH